MSFFGFFKFWFDVILSYFFTTNTYLSMSKKLTHDTFLLTFKTPKSIDLKCGQHILCTINDCSRKYTPISDTNGYVDIIVKKYETGKVSKPLTELKTIH